MKQVVAYLVNEHPTYMRMAGTSMEMLRRSNPDIPVVVFLIRDKTTQTIERENITKRVEVTEEPVNLFKKFCSSHKIEVRERPPLIYEGEETFFHINRRYLAELDASSVLYIDSDTFIFGDVEQIFDNHAYADFVACLAEWANARGWDSSFVAKPIGPYSSGVMLFNHGSIQDWCDRLPVYLAEFRKNESPLSKWLYSQHSDCLLREEFSVTHHIALSKLVHSTFSDWECYLIRHDQCIQNLGKSIIFHCYAPNWKKCYNKIYHNDSRKIALTKIHQST